MELVMSNKAGPKYELPSVQQTSLINLPLGIALI